jgi:hypothetical protein
LNSLYLDAEQWRQAAQELGVTHIFWGPREREHFQIEAPPWILTLKNVSAVEGYEVYVVE